VALAEDRKYYSTHFETTNLESDLTDEGLGSAIKRRDFHQGKRKEIPP